MQREYFVRREDAQQGEPAVAESQAEAIKLTYREYHDFIARVVSVMGDEYVAHQWLHTPDQRLEGKTPLETAQLLGFDTPVLDDILGALEHGVYS